MKIFLTGGNGMLGKNIIALAECHGFDIDAPGHSKLELLNYDDVLCYLELSKPDVILHCAGLVGGVHANIAAPFDFALVNLQIGTHVVKAANVLGIEKLLNVGSANMFPRTAKIPLQESSILTGQFEPDTEGYSIAKVAVARLAQYANAQFGRQYKTIIPCNLYGFWDKFDPEKSHMIPAVIRRIHEAKISNHLEVEIWGDGSARREFLFAEDLADFLLFAVANMDKIPELINVGLGVDYSINDYYNAIAEVVGYNGNFRHDLSKPVGIQQKLVDTSLQTQLGWQPKHSLMDGLAKTYQFFLNEVM